MLVALSVALLFLPVALALGVACWHLFYRSRLERARMLFVDIVDHARLVPAATGTVTANHAYLRELVHAENVVALRAFLADLRRDYPKD